MAWPHRHDACYGRRAMTSRCAHNMCSHSRRHIKRVDSVKSGAIATECLYRLPTLSPSRNVIPPDTLALPVYYPVGIFRELYISNRLIYRRCVGRWAVTDREVRVVAAYRTRLSFSRSPTRRGCGPRPSQVHTCGHTSIYDVSDSFLTRRSHSGHGAASEYGNVGDLRRAARADGVLCHVHDECGERLAERRRAGNIYVFICRSRRRSPHHKAI